MSIETSYLFATPSFISGLAMTLDMGSTLEQYNTSRTPDEADIKALQSDWRVTGADIRSAMKEYEQEKSIA